MRDARPYEPHAYEPHADPRLRGLYRFTSPMALLLAIGLGLAWFAPLPGWIPLWARLLVLPLPFAALGLAIAIWRWPDDAIRLGFRRRPPRAPHRP